MKRISYEELTKYENIIYFGNAPQFTLEPYSGVDYDEETDTYEEIYQFYLIDEHFAQYLARATSEIVYFCPELELYVWGVTHFGTPWCGVYLDVKTYEEMMADGTYDN